MSALASSIPSFVQLLMELSLSIKEASTEFVVAFSVFVFVVMYWCSLLAISENKYERKSCYEKLNSC